MVLLKDIDIDRLEQQVLSVPDPNWTQEELLAQTGTFISSKISPVIALPTTEIKRIYYEEIEKGNDPRETVGLSQRENGTRIYVQMSVFGKWFKKHKDKLLGKGRIKPKKIPKPNGKTITIREFLKLKGEYQMGGVIPLLPIPKIEFYTLLTELHRDGGSAVLNNEGIFRTSSNRYYIQMPQFIDFFLALFPEK